MRYLKYTTYVYLFIGVFFLYNGIMQWSHKDEQAWLSFVIALLFVGMFFFRKRMIKKMNERNNKP